MTLRASGHSPDRSGLVAVFRSQAREAQFTLVLSWVVLGSIVTRSLIASIPGQGGSIPQYVALAVIELVGMALLIRSQLVACRGGGHLRVSWVPPVLTGLALVPLLWGVLALAVVYAAVVVALHYRVRHAVMICVALCGVLVMALPVDHPVSALGTVLEIAMLAVIVVAVTVLAVRVDRLSLTQEVLTRRRVDLERDRVARDLHDLMGRTLVAASLRNQAALRVLGPAHPETGAMLERLHEMLSVGQVQLRALTNGPMIAGLNAELEGARTLCARVNINLTVDAQDDTPGWIDSLLGLVVRENITNVLKHSRASWCAVTIRAQDDAVTVSVANNGVTTQAEPAATVDTRLARAVQAAGGTTEQSLTPDGVFQSMARVPVTGLVRTTTAAPR